MEFSDELLFFFSAIGAFNGVLLGFYFLFFAKPRSLSQKFLGMLILMLSIRVGKSVFFYFNPDLAIDYLQFGLTACLFIGPFLYFYVKRLMRPNSIIDKEWKYHLLILVPFTLVFGYIYPFEENIDLWRPYVILHIYHIWLFYIFLSAYVSRSIFKKLFSALNSLDRLDIWVLSLILGNLLLVTIYYKFDMTFYISGALSFSFLLYLSWAFLYFNKENRIIYISEQKKYGNQKIDAQEAESLESKLQILMSKDKLYRDSSVKLPKIAEKLKTNPHRLSQFLNDNLEKSFSQYINEYRIKEAQELIQEKDHLTLEAIGYDVGFNSKSSFYTSFKKYTGMTPANYKKRS